MATLRLAIWPPLAGAQFNVNKKLGYVMLNHDTTCFYCAIFLYGIPTNAYIQNPKSLKNTERLCMLKS
jgi:hypothetical protein